MVVGTPEYQSVAAVADALYQHLASVEVIAAIHAANQPGLSSAGVQAVFLEHARALGFTDESKGLFAGQFNRASRPDYFLPLGDTGVLIEVERGKTTINNMDLLDFWKCHICEHAHYLILLVPTELRQNPTMSPRREFVTVRNRLASFFDDARARYDQATVELERLAIRMALESLVEVLPRAASVYAFGEVDEDGIPRLRTQRVLAGDGSVLFDVDAGHAARSVEDAVDNVDVELLDLLIDLRPDAYSGRVELGP